MDPLFCQLEEGKHNRGNDDFLFFQSRRTRGVIRRTFLVSLIGRPKRSLPTDVSNKWHQSSQHTNNFYSFKCFPPQILEINNFILILCLSQSFSSRQTSIFPLFYFNCVHYCPSFNSSFHALLQKAFSFAINFNIYWHFSLLGLLFVCNFRCCWLFSFQLWRRHIMGCYMSFYFKLLDNTASNYLTISNVT
jgi:hypothetical protein